jgi:hypothetical protein
MGYVVLTSHEKLTRLTLRSRGSANALHQLVVFLGEAVEYIIRGWIVRH